MSYDPLIDGPSDGYFALSRAMASVRRLLNVRFSVNVNVSSEVFIYTLHIVICDSFYFTNLFPRLVKPKTKNLHKIELPGRCSARRKHLDYAADQRTA